MKIEKIEKVASGKYRLTFDDKSKLVTYDDVILKNNLLYHQEVDDKLLKEMNSDTLFYDVYQKCLKLITNKLRSEKEVIIYLDKFNLSDKDVKAIIKKLKEAHLIDDLAFAKAYLADRLHLSTDGPNKIKDELLSKVDLEKVNIAFNNLDNDFVYEKLKKLITKKINSNHNYSNYQLKQKVLTNFLNLGYDKEMILEIFDDFELKDDDILLKEYEKQYRKLAKKYMGDELYLHLKQKLLQKGYSGSEINDIITKKSFE